MKRETKLPIGISIVNGTLHVDAEKFDVQRVKDRDDEIIVEWLIKPRPKVKYTFFGVSSE